MKLTMNDFKEFMHKKIMAKTATYVLAPIAAITIIGSGIMLEPLFLPKEIVTQPTIIQPKPPPVIPINPEIQVIVDYQKSRYSKIPIEVADIQAQLIVEVAKSEDIPIELLVAIAEKESMFNPFSVSNAGATGIVQILQATNVVIDDERRYDIRYGLEIGCKILHGKMEKHSGNLTKALTDYSGGAGDYASKVYENIGRYSMFRNKRLKKQ